MYVCVCTYVYASTDPTPPDRHGPFGAKLKALQREDEAEQSTHEKTRSVENTLAFSNNDVELVTFQEIGVDDDGPYPSRRPTREDKHRQSAKEDKKRRPTKEDTHRRSTKRDKQQQMTKED